jgi:hypothetical protein
MENVVAILLIIIAGCVVLVLGAFFLYYLYQKHNYKYKVQLKNAYENDDDEKFFSALKKIDFFNLFEKNLFVQDEVVKIIIDKFYNDLKDYDSFLYLYDRVVRIPGIRGRRIMNLFVKAATKKDVDFWPKIYIQSIVHAKANYLYFRVFLDKLPTNYQEIVLHKCLERIDFYQITKVIFNSSSVIKIRLENDKFNFENKLKEIEKEKGY